MIAKDVNATYLLLEKIENKGAVIHISWKELLDV
jgi:hypothetical protein